MKKKKKKEKKKKKKANEEKQKTQVTYRFLVGVKDLFERCVVPKLTRRGSSDGSSQVSVETYVIPY